MNYSDFSKKDQKKIQEDSSYDHESLEAEDPYLIAEEDWEEYADSMLTECWEIDDHIINYIDWEKWRRDLGYDYTEIELDDGSIYYFRSF